jgi:hypothetical protein
MSKKLFTEKQVGISAVIGGPIPPGILFYLNYKRINKDKEAYISLASTFIFTFGLFYTLIKLPDEVIDRIPNAVFTAFYGIIVYLLYRWFLTKKINQLLADGHTKASNWMGTAMIILGLALNLLIILAFAISQPAFEGDRINYGGTGHEIYFDKNKTAIDDVNKLGMVLTDSGYFTDEYPVAVHLETWETRYIVTLQIDKEHWDNQEIIQYLNGLKSDLEAAFFKDFTLVLEHYNLSGKKLEKRI